MLIPDFKLSQQPNHIILTIRLPYAKISTSQFYIEDQNFKFYLKPYILNLKFEQKLKPCEEPTKAVFDVDKHLLKIHMLKNTPGEEFTNLDVLSKLLTNKKKDQKKVIIEVVGQSSTQIQQQSSQTKPFSYGFNNNYSDVFKNSYEQTIQLFSNNPETTPVEQRLSLAREQVQADFQLQHYVFDMTQNEQIDPIVNQLPTKQLENISLQQLPQQTFIQILSIPKKDLIISSKFMKTTFYQIADIMFSYFYQLRCMNGQFSVQSALTINETSTVLSNNVNYQNVQCRQVFIESYKRCLTYSLYSHWQLCQQVLKQVKLQWKRQRILGVLSQLRKMFNISEPRYLLNRIYIDDFCVFVEKIDAQIIENMGKQIQEVKITKEDLKLNIQN